jgi:hypothetical protein
LIAIVITLGWAMAVTTPGELFSHTTQRLQSPVGFREFLDQYRFFYSHLFPAWFLWLMPIALTAGFLSRRTRLVVGLLVGVSLAWAIGLPEAAFVHDYWTYPLLAPVVLGLVAGLQWAGSDKRWSVLVGGVVLATTIVGSYSLQTGSVRQAYFYEPSRAGELLRATEPAAGQSIGWVAGAIEIPRWHSYYWDLPTFKVDYATLGAVPDTDLVLIRLDRLPPWLLRLPALEAQAGRYGLVEAATLRRFAVPAVG